MAAFGALVGWHDQPLLAAGITNRLEPKTFPVLSLAAAGWTLAGFALGVLAGILWRRVIPALATAFAAWFGLAYLGSLFRTHYQAPLTTTRLQIPLHDLVTAQWWTKSGARVPNAQVNRVLQAIGLTPQGTGSSIAHPGDGNVDPVSYLMRHGYTQVTSYQPDSRFWPFQCIEFGWLVLLSLVLLGSALWLLHRRPA